MDGDLGVNDVSIAVDDDGGEWPGVGSGEDNLLLYRGCCGRDLDCCCS